MKTKILKPEDQMALQVMTKPTVLAKPSPPRRPYIRKRGGLGLVQSCKSAIEAIRANKLRALLTSLGIIIGVGAVIMMISTSESNASVINQRLSSLNPNELVIRSGSANAGGVRQGAGTQQTLTQADADAITAQVGHVTAVSPVVSANGQVIFQGQNWASSVQGVYPQF